jgi:hypothetical protein
MNNQVSPAQARLKLTLWDLDANKTTDGDAYASFRGMNIPPEISSRLLDLMRITRKVGSKVFAVGKIILLKILDFIKKHPLLVTGLGIGAVLGMAVAGLILSVPFLGTILAPLAKVLGLTITIAGGVMGHRLDQAIPGVSQDIGEIINEFFSFFYAVFNAISPQFA